MKVGRHSTAREVIRAAITRSVDTYLAELPGTRDGLDPEPLHQARVSVRRFRSDLRTFAPLLEREWADPLRDELSWIGRSLGHVRDLDVLGMILDQLVADDPAVTTEEAEPLLAWFRERRDEARAQLLADLDSDRAERIMARMVDAADDPRTAPQADDAAATMLPALMRRPWRSIDRAVGALGATPADTQLHRVRILAKRCRYASEAVAPAVGKPARRFARAMASVQECLGDLNDAVVIGHRLREAGAALPASAFVAGHLSGVLSTRADHSRAEFVEIWEAASDPHLRAWW